MSDMGVVPSLRVSAEALGAQSHRMRVIAENLANAHTTRDAAGRIYKRQDVVFETRLERRLGMRRDAGDTLQGMRVARTVEDNSAPRRVHRPGHPQADADGFVEMPNVNPMEEMVDLMMTGRAYEANVAAMRTARAISQKALEIGK